MTSTKEKQSRNLVYIFKSATFRNGTQCSLADSIFKVKELIQESNNRPKTNARESMIVSFLEFSRFQNGKMRPCQFNLDMQLCVIYLPVRRVCGFSIQISTTENGPLFFFISMALSTTVLKINILYRIVP